MPNLIITEKTSQARDLRAAFGDRFGQILPAEAALSKTDNGYMKPQLLGIIARD